MSKNKISKYLSYILRHKPESIGLTLDNNGWANIDELIEKSHKDDEAPSLNRSLIDDVVKSNDKKRFSISSDSSLIRANQGHSINIDLQLQKITPPEYLYHGTASRFLDSIMQEGLKPQQRQHVHLSTNIETALTVGKRYGHPVILKVEASFMHEQGCEFYLSENGVWLTGAVDPRFISQK